jgi:hypothetical protein
MDMAEFSRHEARDDTGIAEREEKGRISYDDRGNAVWVPFAKVADKGDMHALLDDRSLALTYDDAPHDGRGVQPNPQGLRKGYNPYESGLLHKQQFRKKKDLHALSQWIQRKKQVGTQSD